MVDKTTREGAALLDLLAGCWEAAGVSGRWDREDVADLVTQTLDALHLDLTHPAEQDGGTGKAEDYSLEMLRAFARGEGVHPRSEATCPCGSTEHELDTHPTEQRKGWTPVLGEYVIDDPIAEHRDGEHDEDPQPECCAACRED
ncbi:hypothetical protein [Pseudonocardia sp. NPDC049154]|uniref:hypothetical protein n=1 Tax=Pseudonocardia sp. NPDC049154 TaxID=3155501 RepID=UPI0034014BF0